MGTKYLFYLYDVAFCCIIVIFNVSCGARFTGDALRDFTQDNSIDPVTGRSQNFAVVQIIDAEEGFEFTCDGETCSDVGVPEAVCEAFSGSSFSCPYSGWDIRNLFFQYNEVTDVLQIGIDCFGICGDADGDGDPGASSLALALARRLGLPRLVAHRIV